MDRTFCAASEVRQLINVNNVKWVSLTTIAYRLVASFSDSSSEIFLFRFLQISFFCSTSLEKSSNFFSDDVNFSDNFSIFFSDKISFFLRSSFSATKLSFSCVNFSTISLKADSFSALDATSLDSSSIT